MAKLNREQFETELKTTYDRVAGFGFRFQNDTTGAARDSSHF